MDFKSYLEKLICKVELGTQRHYCTKNPKLGAAKDPDEAFDLLEKRMISIKKMLNLEIINLPAGQSPLEISKFSDEEIDEINNKTLKDIKKTEGKTMALSEEYCSDYKTCLQFVLNDPLSPFLEYQCLKSGGNIKSQWLKCIEAKKQKALKMLQEEKIIAKKDGDNLASEEIDSLCELIGEIDQEAKEKIDGASSEREALNYWPALLLPAPKMNVPDGDNI